MTRGRGNNNYGVTLVVEEGVDKFICCMPSSSLRHEQKRVVCGCMHAAIRRNLCGPRKRPFSLTFEEACRANLLQSQKGLKFFDSLTSGGSRSNLVFFGDCLIAREWYMSGSSFCMSQR